jgi:hypothetical protein
MVALFAQHQVSFDVVKIEILAFVLLSLILIFSPLLFFIRRLIWAKYMGHLYLGKAGVNMSERFEDEWVSLMSEKKETAGGTVDPSYQADFTGVYRYLQDLSVIPFRLGDLIQISLTLFVPFIPVFFMHYSVAELLEKILGVLL